MCSVGVKSGERTGQSITCTLLMAIYCLVALTDWLVAMSCSTNRANIWSVWTDPRCSLSVSHRLVTDVMPMSPACISGSDCSRPEPISEVTWSYVTVVSERCYSTPALSGQVANVAILLELVPKALNCRIPATKMSGDLKITRPV